MVILHSYVKFLANCTSSIFPQTPSGSAALRLLGLHLHGQLSVDVRVFLLVFLAPARSMSPGLLHPATQLKLFILSSFSMREF
jgi:hypothetical protein